MSAVHMKPEEGEQLRCRIGLDFGNESRKRKRRLNEIDNLIIPMLAKAQLPCNHEVCKGNTQPDPSILALMDFKKDACNNIQLPNNQIGPIAQRPVVTTSTTQNLPNQPLAPSLKPENDRKAQNEACMKEFQKMIRLMRQFPEQETGTKLYVYDLNAPVFPSIVVRKPREIRPVDPLRKLLTFVKPKTIEEPPIKKMCLEPPVRPMSVRVPIKVDSLFSLLYLHIDHQRKNPYDLFVRVDN